MCQFIRCIFFLFLLCLSNCLVFAQQEGNFNSTDSLSNSLLTKTSGIRLNAFSPSIAYNYEKPIGEKTIFDVQVGVGFGLAFGTFLTVEYFDYNYKLISYSPYTIVGFKHFYIIESRKAKGKRIENNSANYLGGKFVASMFGLYSERVKTDGQVHRNSGFSDRTTAGIAGVWGFQRSFGKNFGYYVETGPSIFYDREHFIRTSIWLMAGLSKRIGS